MATLGRFSPASGIDQFQIDIRRFRNRPCGVVALFKDRYRMLEKMLVEHLGDGLGPDPRDGFGYFNEVTGVDIIDVAVNRNMLSDERMLTDMAYVKRSSRRQTGRCRQKLVLRRLGANNPRAAASF
jgi:hypothetical protein